MIYIIIFLSMIIGVLVFVIFNLLRKQEKMEDAVTSYQNFLNKLSKTIEASDRLLDKIDNRGAFRSDDEVGFFFTSVKKIQSELNKFKVDL